MTAKERVICSAYTGINFCIGDEFNDFHAYAEKLMGRPVQTIEMATDGFWYRLRELSKEDFHKVIIGEEIHEM